MIAFVLLCLPIFGSIGLGWVAMRVRLIAPIALDALARQSLSTAGVRATTATVSNLGFLGPPLMLAFFGERGAGPLAMAILAEIMILLSLGSMLMSAAHGDGAGMWRLVLRSTVLNPIAAAIVAGAALAATDTPLSAPLERFLGFLGGAAGPTALFALGGALAS